VISRVPDEVITIDDLEEGEWTDDESVEDRAYKNIQELKISEVATGSILTANRYKAHLDGGSQTFVFLEENNTVETYGKFCTRKASENRCVIFYHFSDTE